MLRGWLPGWSKMPRDPNKAAMAKPSRPSNLHDSTLPIACHPSNPTTNLDVGSVVADRRAKLDRLLTRVHALSKTTEGLTLDEMAQRLDVIRRTAKRMSDVIANHFDLDEVADDRQKRFLRVARHGSACRRVLNEKG